MMLTMNPNPVNLSIKSVRTNIQELILKIEKWNLTKIEKGGTYRNMENHD
jgi:hypothetical protein